MNLDNFIDKILELAHILINVEARLAITITILLILLVLVKIWNRIQIEMYFKKHPEEDPYNFHKNF